MTGKKIPKNLGGKLEAIRLSKDYTLDQMAERLGMKSASRRSRVYEWENGLRQPGYITLLKYAKLAGVSTDVLIDDDEVLK